MKWFKNIFSSKASNSNSIPDVGNASLPTVKSESNISVSVTGENRFMGLDRNFIDLIHFKNEEDKVAFVGKVEKIITHLNIKEGMEYFSVQEKINKYNYSGKKAPLPFLMEVLLFDSVILTKRETLNMENKVEDSVDSSRNGIGKIRSYYKALNFCVVNLGRKVDDDFFDYRFEENLIKDTLENSTLYNYARMDTLYALGQAYRKANKLDEMKNCFDKIRQDNYDLAQSTTAKFYRAIGEIYIELNEIELALDWLKSGLAMDSKLGVKKLIDQLEKSRTK